MGWTHAHGGYPMALLVLSFGCRVLARTAATAIAYQRMNRMAQDLKQYVLRESATEG
jgi:hypothetical protein